MERSTIIPAAMLGLVLLLLVSKACTESAIGSPKSSESVKPTVSSIATHTHRPEPHFVVSDSKVVQRADNPKWLDASITITNDGDAPGYYAPQAPDDVVFTIDGPGTEDDSEISGFISAQILPGTSVTLMASELVYMFDGKNVIVRGLGKQWTFHMPAETATSPDTSQGTTDSSSRNGDGADHDMDVDKPGFCYRKWWC